jgi:hypothetical protein
VKLATTYRFLREISESIDDKEVQHMLDLSSETILHLEETSTYRSIVRHLDKQYKPLIDHINEIALGIQEKHPHDLDYAALLWITGLTFAVNLKDSDMMMTQLALFIATQKADFHRIENDKFRLVLTYTHIVLIKLQIEEEKTK